MKEQIRKLIKILTLKDCKMLVNIHNKQHKKIVELSIISNHNIIKQRAGFFSDYLLTWLNYY